MYSEGGVAAAAQENRDGAIRSVKPVQQLRLAGFPQGTQPAREHELPGGTARQRRGRELLPVAQMGVDSTQNLQGS